MDNQNGERTWPKSAIKCGMCLERSLIKSDGVLICLNCDNNQFTLAQALSMAEQRKELVGKMVNSLIVIGLGLIALGLLWSSV